MLLQHIWLQTLCHKVRFCKERLVSPLFFFSPNKSIRDVIPIIPAAEMGWGCHIVVDVKHIHLRFGQNALRLYLSVVLVARGTWLCLFTCAAWPFPKNRSPCHCPGPHQNSLLFLKKYLSPVFVAECTTDYK